MIKAYINYPNPKISLHGNEHCKQYRKMKKDNQRVISVSIENMNQIIKEFIKGMYRFAADKVHNDLCLEIDLDNPEREIGFINTVKAALDDRYRPFRRIEAKKHC